MKMLLAQGHESSKIWQRRGRPDPPEIMSLTCKSEHPCGFSFCNECSSWPTQCKDLTHLLEIVQRERNGMLWWILKQIQHSKLSFRNIQNSLKWLSSVLQLNYELNPQTREYKLQFTIQVSENKTTPAN